MTAIPDELEPLRARWRATLGNTVEAFRALAARLTAAPGDREALDILRRELHRVRGTAGSFGFAGVSDEAAQLEGRVLRWTADPAIDAAERGRLVAALAASLDRARGDATGACAGQGHGRNGATHTLLVVAAEETFADSMRTAAAVRGFHVAVATPAQLTREVVQGIAPHAVVARGERGAGVARSPAVTGLPLVVVAPPAKERAALAAHGVVLVDEGMPPAAIVAAAEGEVLRREWTGTTIVAVDDDPMVLLLVRHVLDTATQRVIPVTDPRRVIDALHANAASLLVADISMPQLSGIELVRAVRRDPALKDLPVLMLSGDTDLDHRQAAHEAGADEILPKPIAPVQLKARAEAQLERLRLTRMAEQRHAVTGLPLAARTMRDGELVVEAMHREGRHAVVAVLQPTEPPRSDRDGARWLREIARVAAALPDARFLGHHDGEGLLLVVNGEVGPTADRLRGIAAARPADYPHWRVGIVGAGDLFDSSFAPLRRAAEEAADVARDAGAEGGVVHRWRPEEAQLAPDVVVVEDDTDLSAMLQYALRAAGFSFRAFPNGRLALDHLLAMKVQGKRPFVLLDVDLPGMDGYSLHERLAAERPGVFSVVFVTVHAGESDQLRALRGGAVDYLTKPLNLRILMAKMAAWRELMGGHAG